MLLRERLPASSYSLRQCRLRTSEAPADGRQRRRSPRRHSALCKGCPPVHAGSPVMKGGAGDEGEDREEQRALMRYPRAGRSMLVRKRARSRTLNPRSPGESVGGFADVEHRRRRDSRSPARQGSEGVQIGATKRRNAIASFESARSRVRSVDLARAQIALAIVSVAQSGELRIELLLPFERSATT